MWALGDSAAVPNAADGGAPDPPTCQHALRQARALARNIAAVSRGRQPRTYHYRMLGQAATLGRHKGVFEALGRSGSAASPAGGSPAPTTSTSCRS